jgi:hypothetical protein
MRPGETFEETLAAVAAESEGASPNGKGSGTVDSLAAILADIERHVRRFVAFGSRHQSVADALWLAHCYAIDSAPAAAYLRVKSAAEESGKSTLLEVNAQVLGERGVLAVSISPSVVFRLRDKVGPVALLLDEIDNTISNRQDDGARDLLALVNAGYRRSAVVYRSEGRTFEPRAFRAFGPAAIAGLGNLAATTESRCIPIVLSRKPRGSCERFIWFQVGPNARALSERLAAWATPAVIERLGEWEPEYPPELRDRQVESWWGLFSIADMAGGPWPELARSAALALHIGQADESSLSLGVLLLAHIKLAFDESGLDRMPTADLLGLLVANEEGPWGRWWGAELNRDGPPQAAKTDLARKLRPFDVRPKAIRMPDGTTPRGYAREDFEEAWAIYLDGYPPATTATTATSQVASVAVSDLATATDRNGSQHQTAGVAGQTATAQQTATRLSRDVAGVAGVAPRHPNGDMARALAVVMEGFPGTTIEQEEGAS